MNICVLLFTLAIVGCSSIHYVEFPGPADKVNCSIKRESSLTGKYRCFIEGQYKVEKL